MARGVKCNSGAPDREGAASLSQELIPQGGGMQKEGLLLLYQVDHLSGEEIGWMFDSLAIPGVRNRNLVPTLTKKGRIGHLLILDIDPEVEAEISNLLFECLAVHRVPPHRGYPCFPENRCEEHRCHHHKRQQRDLRQYSPETTGERPLGTFLL